MAIAFQGSGDLTNNGGTTNSLSHAYTVNAASNLLVVVLTGDVITGGNDDITGVTYNSVSLTLAVKFTTPADGAGSRFNYIYYLLNPPTGSSLTVLINCTNNHFLLAVAGDYSGVARLDATTTDHVLGPVASRTTSLTTVAPNCWVIINCSNSNTSSAGAGDILRVGSGFNPSLYDSNGAVPAGSNNFTFNQSPSGAFINVLAAFAPAGRQRVFTIGQDCSRAILLAGAAWRAGKAIEKNSIITRRSLILPSRRHNGGPPLED